MTRHLSGAEAATPRRIRSEIEVDELANWLRSPERTKPVVVVATHFDRPATRLDPEKIAADLTDVAEVVILESGPHSERLAEVVGPMWGVFGSAGRIYPADTYWQHNPYFAPLFLRHPGISGAKQSEEIIRRTINRDYGTTSTRPVREWDGPCMPGAAPKTVGLDAVHPQRVSRHYDKVPENRPAFTSSLADVVDPLQADIMREMARRAGETPSTPAPTIAETAIAANPVAASVDDTSAGAEPMRQDGSLRAPVRLDPDKKLGLADPFEAIREMFREAQGDAAAATTRAERAESELAAVERARAGDTMKIARLETQLGSFRSQARAAAQPQATSNTALNQARAEITDLSAQNQDLRLKLSTAVERARTAGAAARKATKGQASGADSLVELEIEKFPTGEDAARHAILLAWTDRVPATEKAQHPLPDYGIGPKFVPSLTSLTSAQLGKALRCAVDMLTGLGADMFARQLHPLRKSNAGNSGFHSRDDGAICMRAYIESNSANARRLHFWKLEDGSIELIRIVGHDDVNP